MTNKQRHYLVGFLVMLLFSLIMWAFFKSLDLVMIHWKSIMSECTECVKSFGRNFMGPTHIVPLFVLLLSSISLVRICLYVKNHIKTEKLLSSYAQKEGDVYFLDQDFLAAYCHGIIRPSIYINKKFWNKLNREERKALIAHEELHKKQFHPLELFLIDLLPLLLPLKFFNNWIGELMDHTKLLNEIEADNAAIDETNRLTVAGLLKKALEFEHQPNLHAITGIQTKLSQRVDCIVNKDCKVFLPYSVLKKIGLMTFSLVLLFSFYLSNAQPIVTCL